MTGLIKAFDYIYPSALWLVAIWRLPAALGSRQARCLWGALATMALALTMRMPVASTAINNASGIADLSVLLKHSIGVAALCALLDYVVAIHGSPAAWRGAMQPRHLFALLSIALMSLVFVLAIPRGKTSPDDFFVAEAGSWPSSAYLGTFYAYLGTASALAGWLFWDKRRHIPPTRSFSAARRAMLILTTGCSFAVAYSAYRIVYLVLRLAGHTFPGGDGPFRLIGKALQYTAIALIILGVTAAPLGVFTRYLRQRRALSRLYPLWRDLTAAVPGAVLGDQRRSRLSDLLAVGDLSVRLRRRFVEIGDAVMDLRGYVGDELADASRLATAHLPAAAAEVEAEALWLRAACLAKRLGHPQRPDAAPYVRSGSVAGEYDDEVRWLERVARAYRRPKVRRLPAGVPTRNESNPAN